MDQVIEHVAEQKRVLAEALRVLKPGGALYVACPNYLRSTAHSKISFLPLMPKFLGSVYLRVRGKDPVLLSQFDLHHELAGAEAVCEFGCHEVEDLNCAVFLAKCRGRGANPASRKGRVVKAYTEKPLIGKFALWGASSTSGSARAAAKCSPPRMPERYWKY